MPAITRVRYSIGGLSLLTCLLVSGCSTIVHSEQENYTVDGQLIKLNPKISNSLCMEFVLIEPGDFLMGIPDASKLAPVPPGFVPHQVEISRPFYLGTTEVTEKQFAAVMRTNPSWSLPSESANEGSKPEEADDYPVQNVTWHEAVEFCSRLNDSPEEKKAKRTYRLPTEAEWEFACRERLSRQYRFDREKAVVTGEGSGIFEKKDALPIRPVRSFPPNSLGLYDMRGNVWEWCADWFSPSYYENSPKIDPQGPDWGMLKVVRGSDWVFVGPVCNYPRDPLEPWRRSQFVGFRVVCKTSSDERGDP